MSPPRPCVCDKFTPGRPLGPNDCEPCWKFHQVLSFHQTYCGPGCKCSFNGGTITSGKKTLPLPCVHLGKETGEKRTCSSCKGNVEIKLFSCGAHGECTIGRKLEGVACCVGCPQRRSGVVVPDPPPLGNVAPRARWALVTVASGAEGKALLEVSGSHMRAYAERRGVDFVALTWEGHPHWSMSAKFQIPRVLDHYERIAYVDADVLIRPGAVDLFDSCHEHEIGMVDELASHKAQPQHNREKNYLLFRKRMGFKGVPNVPWMLNAGVMVVPQKYKHLLMPPTGLIEPDHCGEQDHTNSQVLDAYLDNKCDLRLLDKRCNWQSWNSPPFEEAPRDAVLHWSGAGKKRGGRVNDMKYFAERFPCGLL